MDLEIKIGREVEGASVIKVPATCKKVSRRHATLFWHNGTLTIEDSESSNGTYVNGKRIARTNIGEKDSVWLGGTGGSDCYQLDIKKLLQSFDETEKEARTDYSKEFVKIKQAYIDYQEEVAELKKRTTQSTQMPRLLATLVPSVIGLIFLLVSENMTIRILSMSIGSVSSGVVCFLTMGKSSSINDKMNDEIVDLQIKYQKYYCCPKCGMKYPFTTSWKKLEADGKCPNPRCDAEFVKR